MLLPNFFKRHVKTFNCQNRQCQQPVLPNEKATIEMAFRQGPGLKEPVAIATVECLHCGTRFSLQLNVPVVWNDVLNWSLDLATGHGEVAPDPEAPAERIWLRLKKTSLYFGIVGAYRRAPVTYLLVRRIPMNPGLDGRVWDGWIRCRGRDGEIVCEDTPGAVPLADWPNFQQLPEDSRFRLNGHVWRKLSAKAIQRIIKSGPLISKCMQ